MLKSQFNCEITLLYQNELLCNFICMNTVKKGDAFEKRALGIVKKAVEDGCFGVKEYVKIYEKKGYYSLARKKNIIFDLAIEVWQPNASRYSLLYLIECKDYKGSIPVDDVEEFYNKTTQVAEGAFKGVFITNNGYQEGAYNFAEFKRIMLMRVEPTDNYEIILHRTNRKKGTELNSINDTGDANSLIESIIDKAIVNCFTKTENSKSLLSDHNIKTLSRKQIDDITKDELMKINPNIFVNAIGLDIRKLEKYITDQLGIEIRELNEDERFQGSCNITNKVICVHPSLINTNRYPFVLAHELGHFILHQDLIIDQESYISFSDSELNFKTNKYALENPKDWIEWQANYFSTSLLLPEIILRARLYYYKGKSNLHQSGMLYVDDQQQNIKTFATIIGQLAYFFGVTKTNVIYRLKDLKLINDKSKLKSLGHFISEYSEELFV